MVHLIPSRVGTWLPGVLLLALIGTFYAPTVTNPFASDDYLLVSQAAHGLGQAMRYQGGYHYSPFGGAIMALEYGLWGTDPTGYHWLAIALLGLAGLLVARLGRSLGLGEGASWAAALLFSTSGLIHEIPLWACAVTHSASTCLYLTAALAYLAYLRTGRTGYGLLCLGAAVSALLVHEQSLSLPLALLLLLAAKGTPDGLPRPWWRRRLFELMAVFAAAAGYVALKVAVSDGSELTPGINAGLGSRIGPFALHLGRLLVPNSDYGVAWQLLNPAVSGWPKHLWRLAVVGAGLAAFVKLPRLGKILAIWVAAHVAMMVLAVGLASRHYLLPLAPASLLFALTLERLGGLLAAPRGVRPARTWAGPFILWGAVLPLVAIGLVMSQERKTVWRAAGALANSLLEDVAAAHRNDPAANQLYVVDLPDGLPLGESEPAYVFRFGFEDALSWRLPHAFARIARLRSPEPPPRTEPFGITTTSAELATLFSDPGNLVLRYEPSRGRLVRLGS